MEQTLDSEVKALLEGKRGEWQEIAREAEVSYSWLSKFVNGHIDNPGFATLKRLHGQLTAKAKASAKTTSKAR